MNNLISYYCHHELSCMIKSKTFVPTPSDCFQFNSNYVLTDTVSKVYYKFICLNRLLLSNKPRLRNTVHKAHHQQQNSRLFKLSKRHNNNMNTRGDSYHHNINIPQVFGNKDLIRSIVIYCKLS